MALSVHSWHFIRLSANVGTQEKGVNEKGVSEKQFLKIFRNSDRPSTVLNSTKQSNRSGAEKDFMEFCVSNMCESRFCTTIEVCLCWLCVWVPFVLQGCWFVRDHGPLTVAFFVFPPCLGSASGPVRTINFVHFPWTCWAPRKPTYIPHQFGSNIGLFCSPQFPLILPTRGGFNLVTKNQKCSSKGIHANGGSFSFINWIFEF